MGTESSTDDDFSEGEGVKKGRVSGKFGGGGEGRGVVRVCRHWMANKGKGT